MIKDTVIGPSKKDASFNLLNIRYRKRVEVCGEVYKCDGTLVPVKWETSYVRSGSCNLTKAGGGGQVNRKLKNSPESMFSSHTMTSHAFSLFSITHILYKVVDI